MSSSRGASPHVSAAVGAEQLPEHGEDELALIAYGQELLRTHTVREKTFNDAQAIFGTKTLVELTALMGQYAQNAFFLNAFGVEIPEDRTEPKMPVGLELEEEL